MGIISQMLVNLGKVVGCQVTVDRTGHSSSLHVKLTLVQPT